jgi:hypothetical protein
MVQSIEAGRGRFESLEMGMKSHSKRRNMG